MSTTDSNIKLIDQAAKGNMGPLLQKARNTPFLSATTGGDVTVDADYPDDDFWLQVNNANGDGTLSDEQYSQIYDAQAK